MKRYIFCFLLVFLFVFESFGQTETPKDTIRTMLRLNEQSLTNEFILARQLELLREEGKDLTSEQIKQQRELIKVLTFKKPQIYLGPIQDEAMIGRNLPQTGDYVFQKYQILNDRLSYRSTSIRNTYISIGALQQITFDGIYDVNSWLTATVGVAAAKYSVAGSLGVPQYYTDLGLNASLYFYLNERIYLRAHGMYTVGSEKKENDFRPAMQALFPQTYYGAGMGVKITDKIGIEAGMTRELNPFNGKWTNTPYIFPFFSTGRRR